MYLYIYLYRLSQKSLMTYNLFILSNFCTQSKISGRFYKICLYSLIDVFFPKCSFSSFWVITGMRDSYAYYPELLQHAWRIHIPSCVTFSRQTGCRFVELKRRNLAYLKSYEDGCREIQKFRSIPKICAKHFPSLI